MKEFMILFFVVSLVACSQHSAVTLQTNNQNNFANQDVKIDGVKKPEPLPTPSKQFSFPNIKSFGVYEVSRNSDNINQNGNQLPPYKEIEVHSIYWRVKPTIGEKVTVVPLNFEFAPFEVFIIKIEDAKNEYTETCNSDKKEVFWKIELERLTQKEFFEMKSIDDKRSEEFPFDVFVIYPAVEFSRQLKPNELTKEMIPKGSSVNEISAAIDLTNDGTPDLLEIKYCCSGRNMSPNDPNCDYSDCGELWKKVGNSWKNIHSWSPC